MSRAIRSLGPPPPDVRARLTFDARFDEPGDAWRQRLAWHHYPWNTAYSSGTPDPAKGERAAEMERADGVFAAGRMLPSSQTKRIITNGEQAYFVDQSQVIAYGLPWLTRTVDGVLESRAIHTPENFKDVAIQSGNDFTVVAADEAARTITIRNRLYSVQEPSADGMYLRGKRYLGYDRTRVDELDGEPDVFRSHKLRTYPYGLCEVKRQGVADRSVKYESLTYSSPIDREIDRRNENGVTVDYYADDGTPVLGNETTTTIKVLPGEIPSGQWPVPGDVIKQTGRMPWIAQLLTTTDTFSSHYMVIEIDAQYADDKNQFGAAWLWGHYLQHSSSSDGFKANLIPNEASNGSEIDVQEVPGGGAGARGRFRRYHNIHAGNGSGAGIMKFQAETTGRPAVMPGGAEWDEDAKQQHLMVNSTADPNFVSYVDDFAKVRVYWWPPGNPYDKPGNSVEWYVECKDGVFRRIGGALSPPWTEDGPYSAKQIFITNAVGGDFIRGNNLQYDVNGGAETAGTEIVNRFRGIKVWQFVGQAAGGAGQPDASGRYSRGWLPTPGDTTGGSGTGIVQDADAITLTGNAPAGDLATIDGPSSVTLAAASEGRIELTITDDTGETHLTAGSSNPGVIRITGTLSSSIQYRTLAAGTATVSAYVTNGTGRIALRTIAVTVTGTGAPDPNDRPPTLVLPDTTPQLEVGVTSDILIDVTDEFERDVVVTAVAIPSGIVEVVSASVDAVRVRALALGATTLAVSARDAAGQSASESLLVEVIPVQVRVPLAPTVTLSRPTLGIVRLDITPGDNVATTHEVRRDGVLVATLARPTLRYEDADPTAGYRQYAVRAVAGGQSSGDAVVAVDLTAPKAEEGVLTYIDVFSSGAGGGTTIGLGPLTDRVDLVEQAINKVQDQPLIVFRSIAERDAYTRAHNGLRASTLAENEWAIHDGTRFRPSTRAEVLARVDGAQVYGTASSATEAERTAIFAHLDVPGRVLRYVPLSSYEPT